MISPLRSVTLTGVCSATGSAGKQEVITAIQALKIRVFPNQKPWADRTVRAAMAARPAAYNDEILSCNMSTYKAACYELRKPVKSPHRQFQDKMETDFNGVEPVYMYGFPSNLHTGKLMERSRHCQPTAFHHISCERRGRACGNADSSSAFNIIVPPRLFDNPKLLRINTHICNWVLSLHMWVSAHS